MVDWGIPVRPTISFWVVAPREMAERMLLYGEMGVSSLSITASASVPNRESALRRSSTRHSWNVLPVTEM